MRPRGAAQRRGVAAPVLKDADIGSVAHHELRREAAIAAVARAHAGEHRVVELLVSCVVLQLLQREARVARLDVRHRGSGRACRLGLGRVRKDEECEARKGDARKRRRLREGGADRRDPTIPPPPRHGRPPHRDAPLPGSGRERYKASLLRPLFTVWRKARRRSRLEPNRNRETLASAHWPIERIREGEPERLWQGPTAVLQAISATVRFARTGSTSSGLAS